MKLPQFSLRTLFIAVTVAAAFCGWFVYHWQWMQKREAARAWILASHGMFFINGGGAGFGLDENWSITRKVMTMEIIKRPAPWSLRLLGEMSVNFIAVGSPPSAPLTDNQKDEIDAKIPEIRQLFPEADVRSVTELMH